MNHRHRTILHELFAHPVSSNIDPRLVHSMLEALGADLSHGGHGHVIVKLNGHTYGFHDAHHALSKQEVMTLRKFLESAGIDAARDYPLASSAA